MARKTASFSQLIDYFHEPIYDRKAITFAHNFYQCSEPEDVVAQFEHNATFLPKRSNGNYLYHEIIALPECPDVPRDKQIRILLDLVQRYVELRCPRQLAYGRMHLDRNLHFHLCISANEVRGRQRLWLSKGQFANIQAELERYRLEKYPELGERTFYQRQGQSALSPEIGDAPPKPRQRNREGEYKRRTGLITRKEQIRRQLLPLFARAGSRDELEQTLRKCGFSLYHRGSQEGVIDQANGKRYRLKTLGLDFARFVVAEREHGARDRTPEAPDRGQQEAQLSAT